MKTLVLLVLAGAALALAACSGSSAQSVQDITLDANAMKYQPAMIEVVAGRPVRLTFRNTDTVDHDFSIMEFPMALMGATPEPVAGHDMSGVAEEPELHMAALMNQNTTLEFTPSKPGTYEFYCTVAGHREAGMVGTLVVKAP